MAFYAPRYRYRYPVPRRYRVRSPYRYRRRGNDKVLPYVIAGAVALAGASAGTTKIVTSHGHHAAPKASPAAAPGVNAVAAAQAVAFARRQLGDPYLWSGITSAGFDCSGLVMEAYASAGVSLERTSQEQWASERHVPASQVQDGDLVFFAGSDGTVTDPGHVGMVVDAAEHKMIDAYGTGYGVRYDFYGSAASPSSGLSAVVGFTDPDPGAAAVTAGAVAGSPSANVALGRSLASAYGWGSGGQWGCLYALWERESGWQSGIANPSSGAFGIAQALNHGTSGSAAYGVTVRYPDGSSAAGVTVNEYPSQAANSGSARAQIKWGLFYIADTPYGTRTPCGAWSHETSEGWY